MEGAGAVVITGIFTTNKSQFALEGMFFPGSPTRVRVEVFEYVQPSYNRRSAGIYSKRIKFFNWDLDFAQKNKKAVDSKELCEILEPKLFDLGGFAIAEIGQTFYDKATLIFSPQKSQTSKNGRRQLNDSIRHSHSG